MLSLRKSSTPAIRKIFSKIARITWTHTKSWRCYWSVTLPVQLHGLPLKVISCQTVVIAITDPSDTWCFTKPFSELSLLLSTKSLCDDQSHLIVPKVSIKAHFLFTDHRNIFLWQGDIFWSCLIMTFQEKCCLRSFLSWDLVQNVFFKHSSFLISCTKREKSDTLLHHSGSVKQILSELDHFWSNDYNTLSTTAHVIGDFAAANIEKWNQSILDSAFNQLGQSNLFDAYLSRTVRAHLSHRFLASLDSFFPYVLYFWDG